VSCENGDGKVEQKVEKGGELIVVKDTGGGLGHGGALDGVGEVQEGDHHSYGVTEDGGGGSVRGRGVVGRGDAVLDRVDPGNEVEPHVGDDVDVGGSTIIGGDVA